MNSNSDKPEASSASSAIAKSGMISDPSLETHLPSGSISQPNIISGSYPTTSGAFMNLSAMLNGPGGEDTGLAQEFSGLLERELAEGYRVGDQIGHGGCAIVDEAWRKTDDLHVVIKVLHSSVPMTVEDLRIAIKRFIREAELISSLTEDHIVQCVEYGCFYGTPCMVLEFVEGLPLDKLLAEYGALSLSHATGIIEQLLSALAETHDKGIIHRDIKPSNIMVFDSPPPFEIRVLDFGISTVLDNLKSQTLMTQQGNVRGTPSYMAPELFTGETRASAESDLFAVGLVYLECLTGKPAVMDDNFMRIAYKQVNEPLEIPGFIPQCIADIILKLCAKAVNDRYHTARDVLDDIHANLDQAIKEEDKCAKAWLKNQNTIVKSTGVPVPSKGRIQSTLIKILIVTIVLAVLFLAAVIAFLIARPGAPAPVMPPAPIAPAPVMPPAPIAPAPVMPPAPIAPAPAETDVQTETAKPAEHAPDETDVQTEPDKPAENAPDETNVQTEPAKPAENAPDETDVQTETAAPAETDVQPETTAPAEPVKKTVPAKSSSKNKKSSKKKSKSDEKPKDYIPEGLFATP